MTRVVAHRTAHSLHGSDTMPESRANPLPRTTAELADTDDLRSVMREALAAAPVDETMLRRGVWTYVGAERDAGTSPGRVIMALNELIDAAPVAPPEARQALTRRVILWCVEAYFGHLGGEAVGRGDATSSVASDANSAR